MVGIVDKYVGHSRSGRNTVEYVWQFVYFFAFLTEYSELQNSRKSVLYPIGQYLNQTCLNKSHVTKNRIFIATQGSPGHKDHKKFSLRVFQYCACSNNGGRCVGPPSCVGCLEILGAVLPMN